jgi:hypothetical protein
LTERCATLPSSQWLRRTVQAPQPPSPHPSLVPVKPISEQGRLGRPEKGIQPRGRRLLHSAHLRALRPCGWLAVRALQLRAAGAARVALGSARARASRGSPARTSQELQQRHLAPPRRQQRPLAIHVAYQVAHVGCVAVCGCLWLVAGASSSRNVKVPRVELSRPHRWDPSWGVCLPLCGWQGLRWWCGFRPGFAVQVTFAKKCPYERPCFAHALHCSPPGPCVRACVRAWMRACMRGWMNRGVTQQQLVSGPAAQSSTAPPPLQACQRGRAHTEGRQAG